MKAIKLIGGILIIGLVGIQFFPVRTNMGENGTAKDLIVMYKAPADIGNLLTAACYNCHSNHTDYPWYSRVQPVGWLIGHDIKEGRDDLNLGKFGTYTAERQKVRLESMIEHIEKNEMPLPSYRLMHPEARLSEQEKQELISWLGEVEESL